MTKTSKIITSFNFIGKLSKITYKKNQQKKIKYLELATEAGSYWIKIPRQLRKQLASLSQGCELEVQGKVKQDLKTGKIKYKAQTIIVIATDRLEVLDIPIQAKTTTQIASSLPALNGKIQPKPKAKVLICSKSNCWKKGGQKLCDAIQSALSDRDLTQQIPIEQTGCLKQCKKAPALVMMPDKACYNKVQPIQVGEIVKKHLITC
jgi:(2Fe-2S) ferredoxin